MRPLPGSNDLLLSRAPRSTAVDGLAPNPPTSATPVTCFITTEAELDAAEDVAVDSPPSSTLHKRKCGVDSSPTPTDTLHQLPSAVISSASTSPLVSPERADMAGVNVLQPLTPSLSAISGPPSAISSASSRRHSLTASSVEMDSSSAASYAAHSLGSPTPMPATDSPAHQLIMPSVNVPRRRPFTQPGKSLGKLKVLVAGRSGIGKTSLIRSLAQTCEHIVHIDPIDTPAKDNINEVHASTRPLPWWQAAAMSASMSSSRRRRSSTDEVLDRNLCFVDTFSRGNRSASIHCGARYVESQLLPLLQKQMSDSDMKAFLKDGAAPIVDVVLYMLSTEGPDSTDISCLKLLQSMTNVIPILAKADELASDALAACKETTRQVLEDKGIRWFSFGEFGLTLVEAQNIYAVSSATRTDYDTIDASVLMSSEYMQPLVSTDLELLAAQLFSADGSAWLRHSAATKCISWRRDQGWSDALQLAVSSRRDIGYGVAAPALGTHPYTDPRHWKRFEVADWARGLRQSLEAERLNRMSSQELTLDTLTHDALTSRPELTVSRRQQQDRRSRRRAKRPVNTPHQDPLGLLELASHARCGGQTTLELLSSIGVVGFIATWLVHPRILNGGDFGRLPNWCFAL